MAYEILEYASETPNETVNDTPRVPTNNLLRHGARLGARVGETVTGSPGSLAQGLGILGQLASKEEIPTQDIPEDWTWRELLTGAYSPQIEGPPSRRFKGATQALQEVRPPNPSEIKEKYTKPFEKKYLPENYLSSQNKYEEAGDELISDIAAMANPLLGLIGTPMKIGKA